MSRTEVGLKLSPLNAVEATGVSIHSSSCIRRAAEPPYEQAHDEIFAALKQRIEAINHEVCDPGEENSFFVCDIGEVQRLHNNWYKELPRVQPFYAVKCNPDPKVLLMLASLGVNFDCASKSEIERVLQMGVDPERIIYANPCKASSFIRYAARSNVLKSTFDNIEELHKIKKFHPKSQLLLRIATDDSTAQCRLSTKYGCEMEKVESLLKCVKDLELNLVGVSFHVGSGASDFTSLYKAVRDSSVVFEKAKDFDLPALKILDVGGGFQFESFADSSAVLRAALDEFFPPGCAVDIIAEPGRYFAATAFTLAANVIAKRKLSPNEAMLYINDGVYGNMNCILFDHQEPTPRTLFHNGEFHYYDIKSTSSQKIQQNTTYPQKVSIWGPTCDGLDCITKEHYMKHDLVPGDWIYFPCLGAYTASAATPFNGFEQNVDVLYIDTMSSS
ncbi:SPE1 (YKL184W) [Zygosaccharomyces parabailii]|nr:SPE1 (YKL184W) [Zygosaccharomyces parabailii]CDH10914.1 probable Ornithine decarboxylase [Zygosaccharomyces bailii ISA1307]